MLGTLSGNKVWEEDLEEEEDLCFDGCATAPGSDTEDSSQKEIRPIWNNVQRVNKQNQFVPTAVLTRTGKIPVNTARASGTKKVSTARHSFNRQAVLTSVAMKVNIVKPIVNKQKVNTAKVNAVSAVGRKRETVVKPSASFKNKDVIEFCGSKGIKREYSNARTPQQNGVAERKNRTLIEAAKIMLADSFLPNTFWAQAVSTACYVLNRVLLTQPHNKTPYELITGKIPIISYIRPFGCHVTILNTIDHLGKFDGKSDEGFLVGYSLQSKAFRVYNLETKRVEENLHITFLENKPNVARKGPSWLFDLDYLTDSMNYQPVRSENQANKHAGPPEANQNAGTEDIIDAGDSEKEDESAQDYFVLPIGSSYSSTIKRSKSEDAELRGKEKDANDAAKNLRKEFAQETENFLIQVGAAKASSTNIVNTVSTPVSTDSPYERLSLTDSTNPEQDDSEIPHLEDIYQNPTNGIFTNSSYDDEGAVADFTNLESHGYIRGTIDKTLFIKKDKHDIILVQVYVDDIIFGSTKKSWCDEFEALMKSRFQMSSMGELTFFLRLQVKQKADGIFISQDKYVAEILKKFDFVNVKTASTPMEDPEALAKGMCKPSHSKDLPSKCCQVKLFRKSTTGGCQFLGRRLILAMKSRPCGILLLQDGRICAVASCLGASFVDLKLNVRYGFNLHEHKDTTLDY
ncbi:retrovirus-related pol polyprotein from transposon TNT 1-94 [Tanacetum coccineum]